MLPSDLTVQWHTVAQVSAAKVAAFPTAGTIEVVELDGETGLVKGMKT